MEPFVILTGRRGMLGRALADELDRRGVVWRSLDADITKPAEVREWYTTFAYSADAQGKHHVLINAAAMTNVDACEQDPDRAMLVNGIGPRVLSAAVHNVKLVQISTGAVFDGAEPLYHDRNGFDEFQTPRPVSAYARSKHAGEVPQALVIRLGHLYGPGGKNGLSTTLARLVKGERVFAESSCAICPTYVVDAARAVLDIALKPAPLLKQSVVHVAPTGSTTQAEFAREMERRVYVTPREGASCVVDDPIGYPPLSPLGVPNGEQVKQGRTGLAYRPLFGLIRSSFGHLLGVALGSWQDGLGRYLQDVGEL